jgi:hypothetical protein
MMNVVRNLNKCILVHSNKYRDVNCEEIVKKNEDFLEHVDSSFEATEINLQPSYFYDHLVVFNSIK